MEDNFKKALQNSREHLEHDKPSAQVWDKLKSDLENRQLPKKTSFIIRHRLKLVAAAGLILMAISYAAYKNRLMRNEKNGGDISSLSSGNANREFDLRDTTLVHDLPVDDSSVVHFRYHQLVLTSLKQVTEQEQKVKALLSADPALRSEMDDGVNDLKGMFYELEKKLAVEIGQEKILEMMVSNLRLQEMVINNQLELLQNLKNKNNENL